MVTVDTDQLREVSDLFGRPADLTARNSTIQRIRRQVLDEAQPFCAA